MSTSQPSNSSSSFSESELELLAKTADALSAYSGKPVMAETGATDGVAWVVFGVPLASDADETTDGDEDQQDRETEETTETDDDAVVWQMGGPGTEWVGNAGGLCPAPDDVYECRLLWAIQITGIEGERFIKLDEHSEVVAWSDHLADLLPFEIDPDEDFDDFDD